ncbi:MAG: serine O-acetyltransferase [Lachnospiraceae bacterium]
MNKADTTNKEEKISKLVDSIIESYDNFGAIGKIDSTRQPGKDVIVGILDSLQKLIFPGYFESKNLRSDFIKYYVGELVEDIQYNLEKQMVFAFLCSHECEGKCREELELKAAELTSAFLEKIVKIREYLETDVQATYDGDPAAYSYDEIIYSYPGLYAIMVSRIAHELYLLGVPLIPRIMTEHAHSQTGIDINPGATIGKYFCIDHGTGIVIGETTVIGEHVKIYQGVTLGGISTSGGQQLKGVKRHPTIMDYVTIYSGASILGGDTVIGAGSVIGGNVFITQSVNENTRVTVKNQELQFTSRA